MAVSTIIVQGKVLTPDGNGFAGGKLEIRITSPGAVDDSGTDQIVGGRFVVVVEADGSVNFELIPNDTIDADYETLYRVKFTHPNHFSWIEYWTLDSGGADPIDIGAITRETISEITGCILVDALPAATERLRGKFRTLRGSNNVPDITYQCLKIGPGTTTLDWSPVVEGKPWA